MGDDEGDDGGYQCDEGHECEFDVVRYPGKGSYKCKQCGSKNKDKEERWVCAECCYDLCNDCAPPPEDEDEDDEGEEGEDEEEEEEKPKKGKGKKCAQGHPLVFESFSYKSAQGSGYGCDLCGKSGKGEQRRWRCGKCNFDCCPRCIPPPPNSAPAASAPSHPAAKEEHCAKGHTLIFQMIPYSGGVYQCDRCSAQASANKPRFSCAECQYDCCPKCVPHAGGPAPAHAQQPLLNLSTSPNDLSPPTSKGKALVIGINYTGTRSQLSGCVNDANNIHAMLTKRGFTQFMKLTDDQHDPAGKPTRANIIKGMKWLMEGAKPGQSLFFSYSGHGGQIESKDGDEDDGMDETICPVDYSSAGQIIDNDLYKMLIKALPDGVRLTCIMDCCHSGTALDLPITYDGTCTRGKAITARGIQPGLAMLISGCEDAQTSADVQGAGGKGSGALTMSWLEVLNSNPNMTYADMLHRLRQKLKSSGFDQVPQLSFNLPKFSPNSPVVF